MPTNFQLKRLKLELDIVEKPENRVHKLTDSNVSPSAHPPGLTGLTGPTGPNAVQITRDPHGLTRRITLIK